MLPVLLLLHPSQLLSAAPPGDLVLLFFTGGGVEEGGESKVLSQSGENVRLQKEKKQGRQGYYLQKMGMFGFRL